MAHKRPSKYRPQALTGVFGGVSRCQKRYQDFEIRGCEGSRPQSGSCPCSVKNFSNVGPLYLTQKYRLSSCFKFVSCLRTASNIWKRLGYWSSIQVYKLEFNRSTDPVCLLVLGTSYRSLGHLKHCLVGWQLTWASSSGIYEMVVPLWLYPSCTPLRGTTFTKVFWRRN